jgi:lipid II:glycine glycyltransferase (peptidoglycan interpeptide bridge formation enzyme)
MQWRGFEIYQNDKFAEIFSRHRNMKLQELEGNKCYTLSAPVFSSIKYRCYLYNCKDPTSFLETTFKTCKKQGIPILEIFTHYNLDELLKSNYGDLKYEDQYVGTFLIDLSLDEEALMMNMKSVNRRRIKKAVKNNITVRETQKLEDFDKWWEIYNITGERGKFVKQSYDMVKEIFQEKEISRLFVAEVDNKIISGGFLLIHKIPNWWLGGSLEEYWKLNPNNLMVWEMIKWSKAQGYPYFDMGGAGRENEGPTEFKRKFGGEYKENHDYSITLKPFKSKMIDKMIKLRYKMSKQI